MHASNLTRGSKAMAQQLAADVVTLSVKVKALEAQLAQANEQRVNSSVNQPSSKKPEWDKGNAPGTAKPRRKRKPGGRRPGAGHRPKTAPAPDRSVHNRLEQCPHCETGLNAQPVLDTSSRIVEDIEPPAEKTVVTAETADRKWCPACKKIVSAKSELALPASDIGLNATVLIVYLWVVAALSLPNIQAYLSHFMRLAISTSGLSKLLIRTPQSSLPSDEGHRELVIRLALLMSTSPLCIKIQHGCNLNTRGGSRCAQGSTVSGIARSDLGVTRGLLTFAFARMVRPGSTAKPSWSAQPRRNSERSAPCRALAATAPAKVSPVLFWADLPTSTVPRIVARVLPALSSPRTQLSPLL